MTADVPFNAFGLIDHDQPVLCGDKVRFQGDKVALVVAESKRAATAAANPGAGPGRRRRGVAAAQAVGSAHRL